MAKENTLYVNNRKEWRKWLEKNYNKEREVWILYPKKESGKDRILYNDAVEEALCFGWIDSTQKTFDDNTVMQKFSLRNQKSEYSQANIERLKWLFEKNMIQEEFLERIQNVIEKEFISPKDIINELKREKIVWQNYCGFSDSYKRIRIAYIEGARKRPEEFKKRLNNFIEYTRNNKIIKGHGGIEKYY